MECANRELGNKDVSFSHRELREKKNNTRKSSRLILMNISFCDATTQQLIPLKSLFRDQNRRFEPRTDSDATLPNDLTVKLRLQGATECSMIKASKNLILQLQKQFLNISTEWERRKGNTAPPAVPYRAIW